MNASTTAACQTAKMRFQRKELRRLAKSVTTSVSTKFRPSAVARLQRGAALSLIEQRL